MTSDPSLSVVVPLYEEEPNVAPLMDSIRSALEGRDWETILVNDGSTDGTAAAAVAETERDSRVRVVRLARNYGQATAMQVGFERAKGEVVVSLDGDLQNDPRDIPRLLNRLEDGYDLVVGYRKDRQEPFFTRTLPSRLANTLIRVVTGTDLRDNGCSLKAYRREVLERMHLQPGMHRFVAPLAAGITGARLAEVEVRHHPRRGGESKYGLGRTWRVLADLLTVKALRSFRERPLLLFGLLAAALAALGLGFGAATAAGLLAGSDQLVGSSFVLPAAAFLLLEVAAFLVMLGLISEVALRGRWSRGYRQAPVAWEWEESP